MKKFLLPAMLMVALYGTTQNVGIGTSAPTAQFHTTGTVRHALLSGTGVRPVFADANGNLLTNLPAPPSSSATNGTVQAIPDINCTGVTSGNSLAGLPSSVQSASIKVTLNITHPKLSDLSIYLTAPNGSIINLTAPSAALAGANFTNTVFSDAGALLTSASAPFTGNFKPLANMNASICGITPTTATFTAIGTGNVNPNGNWSLRVIDNTAGNTGTLNSWSVAVLSGLGIDGLWGLKGNAGTNAFNFMGTTDKQALRFKVNNILSGLIDTTNTFLGYQSGNAAVIGHYNTAIGQAAMASLTNGESNTAVGSGALAVVQSGGSNTAMGNTALLLNNNGNENTAIGNAALFNLTMQHRNTAIGSNALYNNQQNDLVAVGESALYNNIGGQQNTAVGSRALYSNSNGAYNTAQGFQALAGNIAGNWNTAVGAMALSFSKTGFNNTAIGSFTLASNTTGNQNVAVGSDALHNDTSGSLNTAVGLAAMYSNSSGYGNTATGFNSLVLNTTGSTNTAIGNETLFSNSTGHSNAAVGIGALHNNTTQSNGVAIGDSALYNNGINASAAIDGSRNTATGSKALFANTTGYFNTASGFNALLNNTTGGYNTAIGAGALATNYIGSGHVAIGENALASLAGGNNNVGIGRNADVGNNSLVNAIAIGYNAVVPVSNAIKLGNNDITNIYTNNNCTLWTGDIFVKSNGIIRNTSSLQLKMITASYVVSATLAPFVTISIPFTFNEAFSTIPTVYVGNITGGPGGFAELIMSVSNVSTTGASLFVSNPRNATLVPNYTVKVVAIGGE